MLSILTSVLWLFTKSRETFSQNRWNINSGTNVFPSGFTQGDSSLFHRIPKRLNLWKRRIIERWHEADGDLSHKKQRCINFLRAACAAHTHSFRAIHPGNRPVHHPGNASLLASMCQHLAHSLTRCHAACRCQLLLHCPLCGWTGEHRDRRAAGEHLCCHMVLGARKLQPGRNIKQWWKSSERCWSTLVSRNTLWDYAWQGCPILKQFLDISS